MADYYEKLGNLLNQALESGEIPIENAEKDEQKSEEIKNSFQQNEAASINQNSDFQTQQNFSEKLKKLFNKKPEIQKGQIIRKEQLAQNNLPEEVQNALKLLDLTFPCTWKEINKKYHKLLKQFHPDTNKNIQKTLQNHSGSNINLIQNAYQLLKKYFNK